MSTLTAAVYGSMTCPGCGVAYPEPHGPECRHCGPSLGWPGASELATLRAQLAASERESRLLADRHASDIQALAAQLAEVTAQRDALLTTPSADAELAGMRALRNTHRTVSGDYSREQARACWDAMQRAAIDAARSKT
jgi:hypothetical protein